MSLWRSFLGHDQRVAEKWLHYFPVYEQHFARFVGAPALFVEIGCGQGGSLQLWKRYLGPHAQIVVRIGDQSDPAFLARVIEEFGNPDVVLDDGSHVMAHLVASFRFLYERLNPNGLYMVEDLHTAYWPEFGGGLRREGSFIEVC